MPVSRTLQERQPARVTISFQLTFLLSIKCVCFHFLPLYLSFTGRHIISTQFGTQFLITPTTNYKPMQHSLWREPHRNISSKSKLNLCTVHREICTCDTDKYVPSENFVLYATHTERNMFHVLELCTGCDTAICSQFNLHRPMLLTTQSRPRF